MSPCERTYLITSTGLQALVEMMPATRLAARCRCAPLDQPVALTMARLISSYVAHWLAVKIAALDYAQQRDPSATYITETSGLDDAANPPDRPLVSNKSSRMQATFNAASGLEVPTADGAVPFHRPRTPSVATTLFKTRHAPTCRLPRDCMRTFISSSGLHTVAARALHTDKGT